MRKIEVIQVGDKAEVKHRVTEESIQKFIELTGDDNKLHADKAFAGATAFKKPVAHGMLGASFISTVIGTKLPGDGALWYSQSLEFLLPVRVGDEITVKAEVIKKNEKHNIVELQTDIYNQDKQKVTTGIAKVKIVEPEAKEEATAPKSPRKVALVIGGTGGIGRETCMRLASEGFDVAIHYNSKADTAVKLKKHIEELGKQAAAFKCDIRKENEVKEMLDQVVRKFDTITALIFCGTKKISNIKLGLLNWEDIQEHIDINVKGSFYLAKHTAPIMEKQTYGKMVFLTTQAIESPNQEWLSYITAKSALHGMAKALAIELAPKGIRVNMVSPSMTDTDLISDIPEKAKMIAAAKTPLGRLAKPSDVAGAISFLVSEKSDFINGETIRVNGGQVML